MSIRSRDLLARALTHPESLDGLTAEEWSRLVYLARAAGLPGRLAVAIRGARIFEQLPDPVQAHIVAAERMAAHNATLIRFEIDRLQRAFWGRTQKLVLLKGAAYLAADFAWARGRLCSDIDILVAREELELVEATLLGEGWQPLKLNPYDQHYYRQWMHELPPLRHKDRRTTIDVHHTILPPTGRLKPDPVMLLRESRCIDGNIHVLSPEDMLLHSAVHLFQDGEIRGGLRDLVDQRDMMIEFGRDTAFWPRLMSRARALGLGRPLYYALRYAPRLLDASVPREVLAESQRFAPPMPVRAVMDRLVPRVIFPRFLFDEGGEATLAAKLLYLRSHWLRMPPGMLAGHLARKGWRRLRGPSSAGAPGAAPRNDQ